MEKTTNIVVSDVKVGKVVEVPSVQLNREQIINVLFGVKGVTFIGAETTTIPDMNKGGRNHDNYMYDNTVKDSTIHCMLGFDYEGRRDTIAENKWVTEAIEAAKEAGIDIETVMGSVKNLKEHSTQSVEKFEAKPRGWGTHMLNPTTGKSSRIMVHHTKKDKDGNEILETYKRYMQVEVLGAKTPIYRYKDTGEVLSDTDMACVKKYLKVKSADDMVIRNYSIENVNTMKINKRRFIIL